MTEADGSQDVIQVTEATPESDHSVSKLKRGSVPSISVSKCGPVPRIMELRRGSVPAIPNVRRDSAPTVQYTKRGSVPTIPHIKRGSVPSINNFKRGSIITVSSRGSVTTIPDDFNPCVTDTFLDVTSTGIVLVPWRVFRVFPDIVHPLFRTEEEEIVCDGHINILMGAYGLAPPTQGYLDELTQSWVLQTQTEEELESVISKFSSHPTLLSVVLTIPSILTDSSEIPMVAFLSQESKCIKDLVTQLEEARHNMQQGKKFSVEVDLGPSVKEWGKKTLNREFLIVGGRFCVTSGTMFNHIFDWNNVIGCIPCLPCGVIGSSAYRIHRKINYKDVVLNDTTDMAIIGTKGLLPSQQQYAVYLLMHWLRVFHLHYCRDCRRRLPVQSSHMTNVVYCQCNVPPEEEQEVLNEPEDETVGDVSPEKPGSSSDGGELSPPKTKKSKPKGPYAPYREQAAGQAIERRKKALLLDKNLTKEERNATMKYLNEAVRKGSSTGKAPKAVFKYPKQNKRYIRAKRVIAPKFVEVEFQMTDKHGSQQSDKPVVEMSMPSRQTSPDHSVEDSDDTHDDGFYFTDSSKGPVDTSLSQQDLRDFLTVGKKGAQNSGNAGSHRKAVTKQPKKSENESKA